MTTIDDIYAAINPMPAMLSAKGLVKPEVQVQIEANARIKIMLAFRKPFTKNDWERSYEFGIGNTFEEAAVNALEVIAKLPTREEANLQHFMAGLGKLIDQGKDAGIGIDYLNPLLDSMKKLSDNAITYQPEVDDLEF